jgi:hypothetical protein
MSLSTKTWRRVLLSVLAAAVLLLPAVSQAAPRAVQAPRPAVSAAGGAHAGPAQWLARMWHGVTGLWQTVAAAAGTGAAAGSSTTGDSGASIDPDGHHG